MDGVFGTHRDNHDDVQRFAVDDIRLDFLLWGHPDRFATHESCGSCRDVFIVVHGARRRAANLVCENRQGQLRWYLDTATQHPLMSVVDEPAGLSENDFFVHYEAFDRGGMHTWVRERTPLSTETINGIVADLIRKAAARS